MERSLRRVAVGYRVLATVWLVTLAVTRLVTSTSGQRLSIVVLTTIVAISWTIFTVSINSARPHLLRSWGFLVADAVISIGTYFAAIPAGTADFAGGYPIGSVVFMVYGANTVAALVVTAALIGVAVVGLFARSAASTATVVTQVFFFGFVWVAAAWIVRVMRTSEELRKRIGSELATARAEQVRAEERSEIAAVLHDSVLQTLSLVQRRADDPSEVRALARAQERDLRSQLFGSQGAAAGFADTIKAMAAEVEDRHRVSVEVVTVGDGDMDDHLEALVGASREAVVNAAKHSGESVVSVYAEIGDREAAVFVRDRGVGFVPSETHDGAGIRESVVGRMNRHGGSAVINSSPEHGTEVEIRLPRAAT